MYSPRLTRRENEVMGAVFTLAGGKERFLVSPRELLSVLPASAKLDEDALDRILRALELDGYFETVLSDRKGEKTYVVHMRAAGLAFRRQDLRRRRDVVLRLAFAGICGLLSAALGLLLKVILS